MRIHRRRVDDRPRVEDALGIEGALHLAEGAQELRAVHPLDPERPHPAIAMLARHRTAELAHQVGHVRGDCLHPLHVVALVNIDERAQVEAPDTGMAIVACRDRVGRRSRGAARVFGRRYPPRYPPQGNRLASPGIPSRIPRLPSAPSTPSPDPPGPARTPVRKSRRILLHWSSPAATCLARAVISTGDRLGFPETGICPRESRDCRQVEIIRSVSSIATGFVSRGRR